MGVAIANMRHQELPSLISGQINLQGGTWCLYGDLIFLVVAGVGGCCLDFPWWVLAGLLGLPEEIPNYLCPGGLKQHDFTLKHLRDVSGGIEIRALLLPGCRFLGCFWWRESWRDLRISEPHSERVLERRNCEVDLCLGSPFWIGEWETTKGIKTKVTFRTLKNS